MAIYKDERDGKIITTRVTGVLEVNHIRGVVYFHCDNSEDIKALMNSTPLRIGGIQKPIPDLTGFQLDVHVQDTTTGRSRFDVSCICKPLNDFEEDKTGCELHDPAKRR